MDAGGLRDTLKNSTKLISSTCYVIDEYISPDHACAVERGTVTKPCRKYYGGPVNGLGNVGKTM